MATGEQTRAAHLYSKIMAEIRHRIAAIDLGTSNKLPFGPILVKEFCYLQLRMICELVAIGCLVAHGDIKETKAKKLQKEWSADKIIKQLENLHRNFFPQAVRQTSKKGVHSLEGVNPPPLTKQQFLKLYHDCGEVLHRGNARSLTSEEAAKIYYPDITSLAQKLVDLLSIHTVVMRGGEMMFFCILTSKEKPDHVHVAIAEWKPLPKSSVPHTPVAQNPDE